jgi:signal transduction histidine kinase
MNGGASPRQQERRRWLALVIGVMVLHTVVVRGLLAGNDVATAIATDLEVAPISVWAACACLVTARRCTERHARIAWGATAVGVALWSIAGVTWSFREIVLGDIAPSPSLLDAPFFALAPSFAIALVFYNRQHPSHTLQLRQFADIGILTATIVLLGTLVLAGPLEASHGDPYVYVAVGYPAFYLAVILAAFTMLAGHDWGPRRIIISLLICAHFMFAIVDLLYGAKVLEAQYQTEIEDTMWLGGFLLIVWAAREERALVGVRTIAEREPASPDAVVGAIVIAAIGALGARTVISLEGAHWMLVAVATLFLAVCVAVRVWVGGRLEDAYADAVADGESKTRALTVERDRSARLRGAGSLTRGTAHEVNNMLQAIAGNFALLRRRATRSEDITPYLTAIEQVLERLNNEVAGLRRVATEGGALQVIALLPGGDPDGRLAPILADAGYAPATIPSVPDALLALKSGTLHTVVASRAEADALAAARVTIPVIVRDGDDLLQVVISIVSIS